MAKLCLVILSALCLGQTLVKASYKVTIKNGTLEGSSMQTRNGRTIVGFKGIPYALPPVGELRFEPPKPANSWKGVRFAKDDAEICTQRNIYTHQEEIVGGEDCLYLNVYTPKLPKNNNEKYVAVYPVMIWFHGGGWVTGAGHSEYYGPKFLLDHDVILVTVNYRLGPLGFLSTEDMVVPGNNGMKDQAQAIRWVHENIASFGGDPNRVTLFGESAGGVSVHYHMISPLSQGLFHRGISQSGVGFSPWALTRPGEPKKKAHRVGELLGCASDDSKTLISCLRTKNPVDIIGTDRDFTVFDYCPMIPFRPVIEPDHPGAFLKEDPAISIKSGRVADIPWMTGFTSDEGALKTPSIFGLENGKYAKMLDKEFLKFAPISLLYGETCAAEDQDDISEKIRKYYLDERPIDISTLKEVTDMYSDAWFTISSDQAIREHLKLLSSPVYYYYLAYRGSQSFSSLFGDAIHDYGVGHADDLQYLFPVGEQLFKGTKLNEDDNRIVDVLTSLWYNFAKTGNPTPEITPKFVPVKWQPVRTDSLEHLHIGGPKNIYMSRNLFPDKVRFWSSLPIRKTEKSDRDYLKGRNEL